MSKVSNDEFLFVPLGGTGEIGMNLIFTAMARPVTKPG